MLKAVKLKNLQPKKTKKINVNKLIDSEKPFSEYTHEEEKALKMELLRLRCHEEFSKKFEKKQKKLM